MEQVPSPPLADAGKVRELVDQPCGDEDSTGAQNRAAAQVDVEATGGLVLAVGRLAGALAVQATLRAPLVPALRKE